MQMMTIAIAISVAVGGALGAGATSIAYSIVRPAACVTAQQAARPPFPVGEPAPLTGHRGF